MVIVRKILVQIRLLLFLVLNILTYILIKPSVFLVKPNKKIKAKVGRFFFNFWSNTLIKIVGGKVEVKNWPIKQNTIFLSNHTSYLDIIILNSIHPFSFVSKSEVGEWPIIGGLTKAVDTILLDRKNPYAVKKLASRIDEKITNGDSVLIFPEGTTSNGKSVLEFKKGIFMPILNSKSHNNKLGCISIKYELDARYGDSSELISWWGDMTFFKHFLKLLSLPHWKVTVECEIYEFEDRKQITKIVSDTNKIIRDNFEKL